MDIGDRNIDVVTEGIFIEKGSSVKVIAIKGNRVVVSLLDDDCG
jgi:membrane-bound ClpP family serine protease